MITSGLNPRDKLIVDEVCSACDVGATDKSGRLRRKPQSREPASRQSLSAKGRAMSRSYEPADLCLGSIAIVIMHGGCPLTITHYHSRGRRNYPDRP